MFSQLKRHIKMMNTKFEVIDSIIDKIYLDSVN